MAETPQSTPGADKAQSQPRANQQAAGQNGQQNVQGEARSFQQEGGQANALSGAQSAAEAGRQLAETGRSASREVAESWRSAAEPFTAMQMEMTRFLDDTFRQMAGFGLFPALRAARPFAASAAPLFGLPATDIKETDKAYTLDIELPGLTPRDVEISIQGDVLTVAGQKAEVRDDNTAAYRISERRFGRFERVFPIAPDVERDKIQAAFRDGVLEISLPRNVQAGPQKSRIEIKGQA
jgi:HSP20 family protein